MDIYHPVVLFKFSTKRGPSPLLTPPHDARPQRLLLEEGGRRRQRHIHPCIPAAQRASQSVPETRRGRTDGRSGAERSGAERSGAERHCLLFCHHRPRRAGGHLPGAGSAQRGVESCRTRRTAGIKGGFPPPLNYILKRKTSNKSLIPSRGEKAPFFQWEEMRFIYLFGSNSHCASSSSDGSAQVQKWRNVSTPGLFHQRGNASVLPSFYFVFLF